MKNRSNLAWKPELFYKEISPIRKNNEKIRLQTDLEFQQNEIKKLNEKYNIEMFSTKVRGGKAFAAEQKIREFKKILLKSKRLHKVTKTKRFEPRKIIQKAANNMNLTTSQKYSLPPDKIEKKSLESENFQVYDFHRLLKVSRDAERYERHDINFDKKARRKLRSPLIVGEKVLVLAERIRKKNAPGNLYKSTTENISFFNREQVYKVRKVFSREDSYDYWISKVDSEKIIEQRFLCQELFVLKNQFN